MITYDMHMREIGTSPPAGVPSAERERMNGWSRSIGCDKWVDVLGGRGG